jgi:hypothetical protein
MAEVKKVGKRSWFWLWERTWNFPSFALMGEEEGVVVGYDSFSTSERYVESSDNGFSLGRAGVSCIFTISSLIDLGFSSPEAIFFA